MAQIYECNVCGDTLSIADEKAIYAAYCNGNGDHRIQEMEKVSDTLAAQAVAEVERIVREEEE